MIKKRYSVDLMGSEILFEKVEDEKPQVSSDIGDCPVCGTIDGTHHSENCIDHREA